MRNIFFVFIFLASQLDSQVKFCPPGAQWNYLFDYYISNTSTVSDNETIFYSHDSIVGIDTCKVLKHTRYFEGSNPDTLKKLTLIKQKGDTVYYRNYVTQNTWQILYNFAATVGQSWKTFYVNPYLVVVTNTVVVDVVTSFISNGQTLKQLTVHFKTTAANPFKWKITERYGTNYFLFYNDVSPDLNWTDELNSFLCYKDNQFGTKQFSTLACTYSNPVGIKKYTSDDFDFLLYPNPGKKLIQIDFKSSSSQYEIQITNSLSNVLYTAVTSPENSKLEVDISGFKSGMYFLMVFEKGKLISTRKIIKE